MRSGSPFVLSALLIASLSASVAASPQTTQGTSPAPETNASPIAPDRGAAGLWEALQRLHTRASLLMIVAHPDDEDGATLAYESRGLGARVDLLTLDRGEGGANVMSSDYWDALGLVRTEELLQAGRFYGLSSQHFTSLADYGFSKSLEEALSQWGHDRVLEQAVRIVRTVRPLVVCSVFVGGPTDGHGQHAVAGLMAQEVFNAAGDPNRFPEQLRAGLMPWTPVKTYARAPFFRISEKGMYDYANHTWGPLGVTNHVTGKWEPGRPEINVNIPNGSEEPITGLGFQQISREGLGFQRSQNGGPRIPLPGPQSTGYHRFGSHIPAANQETSFFDGIDVSLAGIADLASGSDSSSLRYGLAGVSTLVEQAMSSFRAQQPAAVAPTLAEVASKLDALVATTEQSSMPAENKQNVLHELRIKQQQCNAALVAALGLSLNADVTPAGAGDAATEMFHGERPTFQMATRGAAFGVKVHLNAASGEALPLSSLGLVASSGQTWETGHVNVPTAIPVGKPVDVVFPVKVPAEESYTRPYFHRDSLADSFYQMAPDAPLGRPFGPYPLAASAVVDYRGVKVSLSSVVQVIREINGPGLLRDPMPVGPELSVAIEPAAGVIPLDHAQSTVRVRVHTNVEGPAQANVHLELPSGWKAQPASIPVSFQAAGEEQTVSFAITAAVQDGTRYTVTDVADRNGQVFREGYVTTGYTGLRPYFLYSPATYKTTGTDVKMAPGESIAYVEGSGDDVPAALEQIGVHVAYLSSQALSSSDLSRYDAIVLGVRAYAVRPDLQANNSRLLEYVKRGGVVLVQYNTPEYDHNFGPYPYVMTGDPEEVTDEHSKVTILDPSNPVFQWPNTITTKDFDGWVEERGSKFLQSWDPRYTALLETHDPGQPEQKGGLVYARYGKGVYIYNAYAFYRELPLGVPGAFRLFANMLSLPRNPALH